MATERVGRNLSRPVTLSVLQRGCQAIAVFVSSTNERGVIFRHVTYSLQPKYGGCEIQAVHATHASSFDPRGFDAHSSVSAASISEAACRMYARLSVRSFASPFQSWM